MPSHWLSVSCTYLNCSYTLNCTYNLTHFEAHIHLWNHHYTPDNEPFLNFQKFPCVSLKSTPPLQVTTDLSVTINLTFFKICCPHSALAQLIFYVLSRINSYPYYISPFIPVFHYFSECIFLNPDFCIGYIKSPWLDACAGCTNRLPLFLPID